jgi:cytochrome c
MYNGGKIIVGIVIFLGLITFPIYYNAVKAGAPPKLEMPDKSKGTECVMPTKFMKSSHMELLDSWRNDVVRNGLRVFTSPTGKKYNMSLQVTCMNCHTSKANFCDRCHNYLNVAPKCWECHIEPVEKSPGRTE